MADLEEKIAPVARALLSPGETLVGCCVAVWQKTFSGRMVAIAVAPDRIILQPLTRRFQPDGDPIPFPPARLASVRVRNGIGGSVSLPSILTETVSVSVDLSSTDGLHMRLMLMGAGGQVQHDGIAALLAYLQPLLEPDS